MRIMYDGIDSDAAVIPTGAALVAGYVDGDYAWTAADWARFPASVHVKIAVKSTTNAGSVLDVETGDATPAESVNWALTRRGSGADPTVYCNTTTWPAVRSAFQARRVPEPHYWVASYNSDPAIPAGAIAHQYASFTRWDLSSVADYWPGVDPVPSAASKPVQLEEDDVSTPAIDGYVTLTWATGSRHVVQVGFDRIGGNQPDLRVVLRLFDDAFASTVYRALNASYPQAPTRSRSVSYLAAPAFAAAMMGRQVLAAIPVERQMLLVATVGVGDREALAGQTVGTAFRAGGWRVVGLQTGSGRLHWNPEPEQRLERRDRVVVVATREGLGLLLRRGAAAEPDPTTEPGTGTAPVEQEAAEQVRIPGPAPAPDPGGPLGAVPPTASPLPYLPRAQPSPPYVEEDTSAPS